MKRTATIAAAFALGGAAALLFFYGPALRGMASSQAMAPVRDAVWVEIKWPLLMDQWGEGTAFQCKAADCGVELNLYLRAKFGFCSSTVGVNDDEELERLANFDFMDGDFAASGGGHPINVAWMKGRIRAYESGGRKSALTAAFNNDSDAMVATVLLPGGNAEAAEVAVVEFLNSEVVKGWVKNKLGM